MKIAIIIPCRNEVQYIEECITAIYNSDLDSFIKIEVFVVDGKSDDGTIEKITDLIPKYQGLFIVVNEKKLTPFAFNLGIYACPDADFYQIVGARHIVSPNYFSNCLKRLEWDKSIWCVGGKIINEYINETGKIIAVAMSTTFGMGLGNFRTLDKSGFTDTVTSPMYPKHVFEKIGYFDEELIRNQDDDFNFRVLKAGGKIFYDHEISLKYYVRGTFKGLWKQFFQYGYWKVYVNKKHKAITTFRQMVPPMFVLYLILLVLACILFRNAVITTIFAIPFVLYILMATYFSIKACQQEKDISFLSIFKTYLILHLSYGLGYLKGILHFIVQGRKPSEKEKSLSR